MLEIRFDHALRYVARVPKPNGGFDEDNYPVSRGTALKLDRYGCRETGILSMAANVPDAQTIKRWLRADYSPLFANGYTADNIHDCLIAFEARRNGFEDSLEYISRRIQASDSPIQRELHSVRYRTKDSFHLVDKLRRKCKEGKNITADVLFTKDGDCGLLYVVVCIDRA